MTTEQKHATQSAKSNLPPFPRFLEVASGTSTWTPAERAAKLQSSWWLIHEAEAYMILARMHDSLGQPDHVRANLQAAATSLQQITNMAARPVAKEYVRALLPDHLEPIFESVEKNVGISRESTDQQYETPQQYETTTEQHSAREAFDRLICAALDSLSVEDRKIIELSFFSSPQMSDQEIATAVGLTIDQFRLKRETLIQQIASETDQSR